MLFEKQKKSLDNSIQIVNTKKIAMTNSISVILPTEIQNQVHAI